MGICSPEVSRALGGIDGIPGTGDSEAYVVPGDAIKCLLEHGVGADNFRNAE